MWNFNEKPPMHEAALALGLIDLVDDEARRHHAKAVRVIQVELGALSCVDPDAFAQAVDIAGRGRSGDGARLELSRPPGTARCMACGADVTLTRRDAPCPDCASHRLLITSGDQMRLTAIEVA
jgi:hydrogenase nickel incorporation protein HypA/HybF